MVAESGWPNYSRIAKAVEMMAAAKLMLLGHHVAVPLEDDGVDLIVDYRWCVQVKCSSERDSYGRLKVKLNKSTRGRRGVYLNPHVNALVVFARDTERWWVVPLSAFRSGVPSQFEVTEHLAPARTKLSELSSFLDAWWVFDESVGGVMPDSPE